MLTLIISLLFWHALADFPLQGDFLSKAKNPLGDSSNRVWPWCMSAHCMIHAGGVYVITNRWELAIVEFVSHFLIDILKCRGFISFGQDQTYHLAFKIGYVTVVMLT